MLRAALVWLLGLVTVVPYGVYYLFVHARRDEIALVATLVLFWVFGYWGVVGPLLAAIRVRRLFRRLETAGSRAELAATLGGAEAEEVVIDLLASENGIPRFLARRIYRHVPTRLKSTDRGAEIAASISRREGAR
jgi:hypothetical protein